MKHRHVFILSLFIFSFFSLIFPTQIPTTWPDAVLFFNPSWELMANGTMRTSVLTGLIPGMDTHTLWMPPLYIIFLSGIMHIFPSELLTARLLSSFISLGSIYLVYKICLEFQCENGKSLFIFRTWCFLLFDSWEFLPRRHRDAERWCA